METVGTDDILGGWTVRKRRDVRWNLGKGVRMFQNQRAVSMFQCQLGNLWLR